MHAIHAKAVVTSCTAGLAADTSPPSPINSILVAERALVPAAGEPAVISLTKQCSPKDKLYLQTALPLDKTCPLACPLPQPL